MLLTISEIPHGEVIGGGLRHWSTPLDPPTLCRQLILSLSLPALGKALSKTFWQVLSALGPNSAHP